MTAWIALCLAAWPSALVDLLAATWDRQERFVQWEHHAHKDTLDASRVQPQGDPWGPLLMSLWVQAGVRTVLSHCETQPNQVSCKTYLDDRSCTARSAIKLHDVYDAWSQWSHSVGLVDNLAKCVVSAAGKRKTAEASEVFDPSKVSAAVRVLGAVSCSVRRALHSDEVSRLESARKCARLLGCCGFSLDVQLRYLRQFLLRSTLAGSVDLPLGLSRKSFGPAFGLLFAGVAIPVLGFGPSFSVGTSISMSLGLLGSCLRSSVSVSPKVVVLLGPGLLALLLMLCVPG